MGNIMGDVMEQVHQQKHKLTGVVSKGNNKQAYLC